MKRWAIFIDVEGTSKIYETQKSLFFHAFESMLISLCRIGEAVFPESPDRLFAHQVGGDGVVIVSEFEEGLPETPILDAAVIFLGSAIFSATNVEMAGFYGDIIKEYEIII